MTARSKASASLQPEGDVHCEHGVHWYRGNCQRCRPSPEPDWRSLAVPVVEALEEAIAEIHGCSICTSPKSWEAMADLERRSRAALVAWEEGQGNG